MRFYDKVCNNYLININRLGQARKTHQEIYRNFFLFINYFE